MDFSTPTAPVCFLMDNGSLRPAATRGLRGMAAGLGARLGRPVEAVSLLHADKVPARDLDGIPAEVFATAIRRRHAAGARDFVVLPLFFGLSGALTDYLPREIAALEGELDSVSIRLADPVAGANPATPDPRLQEILVQHARTTIRAGGFRRPAVVLVDHGSPQREVARLRDGLAASMQVALGTEVRSVVAASMERREGEAYDFNEPLLARALQDGAKARDSAGGIDVVVVPLFFLPGRHAGPGGDIAGIAQEAEAAHPGLRVHFASLVGEHPLLLEILASRYRAIMDRASCREEPR